MAWSTTYLVHEDASAIFFPTSWWRGVPIVFIHKHTAYAFALKVYGLTVWIASVITTIARSLVH